MTSAAELAAAVRRATQDTPYTVVDETADGFTVHIDVVDAQWWTLMRRKSLSKAFTHIVSVNEAASTYTVTDRSVTVRWEAGVSGGVPRPVLEASVGFKQGTLREFSFRKEYGIDDSGNAGAVVDYAFTSAEGNRLIDQVAQGLGLEKKINTTARVGLVVAVVGILGAVVALLVLWLTGAFG